MNAGILPIKRLDEAKGRLTPGFEARHRAAIARALVEDAFRLCSEAEFLRWFVVTDDHDTALAARKRGYAVVDDPRGGLNEALAVAIGAALEAGAASVTIVPADVPLASRSDLEDLIDTGDTSDVVLVPSRNDGGTNGLYLSPPGSLEPRFGPASLRAHTAAAEELGLRCSILDLPRLALDIDTVDDARALLEEHEADGATVDVLRKLLGSP